MPYPEYQNRPLTVKLRHESNIEKVEISESFGCHTYYPPSAGDWDISQPVPNLDLSPVFSGPCFSTTLSLWRLEGCSGAFVLQSTAIVKPYKRNSILPSSSRCFARYGVPAADCEFGAARSYELPEYKSPTPTPRQTYTYPVTFPGVLGDPRFPDRGLRARRPPLDGQAISIFRGNPVFI